MVNMQRTLAYKLPELASQWDHSKNDKTPADITFSSAYKAWWICPECAHNWQQSVNNRKNGRGCPNCAGRIVHEGINDFATTHPQYLSWWDDALDPATISAGSKRQVQWRCDQGHIFTTSLRIFKGRCPQCTVPNPCSLLDPTLIEQSELGIEDEIRDLLVQVGLVEGKDFLRHDRTVLGSNLELDFVFPERHVAVEFNGLYWHSEAGGKDKNYHYDKWKAAHEKGIQLIQVWEDDYSRNPELIHQMLLHKLSLTQRSRVYARKCKVQDIPAQEAFAFLESNHIQGKVQGSHYKGLYHNEQLVAVSVWTGRKESLYLERYATCLQVVGGLGKLLSAVAQEFKTDYQEIVTFAANDVSNGRLYERLGFRVDKTLPPDYSYIYRKQRMHKFNFRISRFKKDPNLIFQEGLTERELAALNRLPRIWDAGKIRYVFSLHEER